MSETEVGKTTRAEKIARTITGLLCAPVGGAFLTTVIFVAIMSATSDRPVIVGPTSATLTFAVPLMLGAIYGWPIAFIIGWPAHAYLAKRGDAALSAYIVLGACIALALALLLIFAQRLWANWLSFAFFATAGAITGLTFWLIRRPDRDTGPPLPADSPHDHGA